MPGATPRRSGAARAAGRLRAFHWARQRAPYEPTPGRGADEGAQEPADPWDDAQRGVLRLSANRRINAAPRNKHSRVVDVLDRLLAARAANANSPLFTTPLGAFALAHASTLLVEAASDDTDVRFLNEPAEWVSPGTNDAEDDGQREGVHAMWLRSPQFPRIGDAAAVDAHVASLLTHTLCEHPPPAALVHSVLPPAAHAVDAWTPASLRRASAAMVPFVAALVDAGSGKSVRQSLREHVDDALTKAEVRSMTDDEGAVANTLGAARLRGGEYAAAAYALSVGLGALRTAGGHGDHSEDAAIRFAASFFHASATAHGGAQLTDLLARSEAATARRRFAREAVSFAATRVGAIASEAWPQARYFHPDAVDALMASGGDDGNGEVKYVAHNNAVEGGTLSACPNLLAYPSALPRSGDRETWEETSAVEACLAFILEEQRRNSSFSLKGRTPARLSELSMAWGGAVSVLDALNHQGEVFQRNEYNIKPCVFEDPVHIPELGDDVHALVRVEEILSIARLEAQGQLLGNCLRGEHNGGYNLEKYARRARAGVSSFWSIDFLFEENDSERVHVALLVEVWNDERIIHQAEGPRPRTWPSETAWAVLQRWGKAEGLRPESGSWDLRHHYLW